MTFRRDDTEDVYRAGRESMRDEVMALIDEYERAAETGTASAKTVLQTLGAAVMTIGGDVVGSGE